MITDIHVADITASRKTIVEYIQKRKQEDPLFTVIDVGGSAAGWSHSVTDWIMDINPTEAANCFRANLNRYQDWNEVRAYVAEHGKFSFAICSHTLEDIANPMLVLEMLPEIAKEGYIAIPSKYREFAHIEGAYRGYIHHRWIFDIRPDEPNMFLGYPKVGFLEHYTPLHKLANASDAVGELNFCWKDRIPFRIVNDDYLGPSTEAVRMYYLALL